MLGTLLSAWQKDMESKKTMDFLAVAAKPVFHGQKDHQLRCLLILSVALARITSCDYFYEEWRDEKKEDDERDSNNEAFLDRHLPDF